MSQMPPAQMNYQGPTPGAGKPAGMAIASMVLGIISLVLFCIIYVAIPCAIVAIILGAVAKGKVKRGEGGGGGMATTGLVLGCIAIGIAILWIAFVAALLGYGSSALEKAAKEAEEQRKRNMGGSSMIIPMVTENVSALWNIFTTLVLK